MFGRTKCRPQCTAATQIGTLAADLTAQGNAKVESLSMRRQALFPPFSDTKVLFCFFKFSSEHADGLNNRPIKMANSKMVINSSDSMSASSRRSSESALLESQIIIALLEVVIQKMFSHWCCFQHNWKTIFAFKLFLPHVCHLVLVATTVFHEIVEHCLQ